MIENIERELIEKYSSAEVMRLMALKWGVRLQTQSLRFPLVGSVIPRFELELPTDPVKKITVRINQSSPVCFDGSMLSAPTTDLEPFAVPATSLHDDDSEGVYKFGMMRCNAPRSWVYDYHTYCCYKCAFCFKESEWEIRKALDTKKSSYAANFEQCLEHAASNGSKMSDSYDIVWLCTGSIPNHNLELERHTKLARALRTSGYRGEIYLSQVISREMFSDSEIMRETFTQLKESGVTRFNTGLEIADPELRDRFIEGHKGTLRVADYVRVFEEAVSIFGRFNVGSCLLAGIEPTENTFKALEHLTEIGVAPAPTVFTPFTIQQLDIPFIPTISECLELREEFIRLLESHGLPKFSGVFSLV